MKKPSERWSSWLGPIGLVVGIVWGIVQIYGRIFPTTPHVEIYCESYPARAPLGLKEIDLAVNGLTSDIDAEDDLLRRLNPHPQLGTQPNGPWSQVRKGAHDLPRAVEEFSRNGGKILECALRNDGTQEVRDVELVISDEPAFATLDDQVIPAENFTKRSIKLGVIRAGTRSHLLVIADHHLSGPFEPRFDRWDMSVVLSEGVGMVYLDEPTFNSWGRATLFFEGLRVNIFWLGFLVACLIYILPSKLFGMLLRRYFSAGFDDSAKSRHRWPGRGP